ncbi:pyridoxamine 5'-phosphate oxidase family protein [Aestuariispira ectoiniformans]|uniref:pyridoxamine 5'-phosphate oxidase family protein n=1 Tax=Aestuariispira ectoiniformans TaxID=2775080 RepID=UPI00223B5B34|nr:pyridoxamine 5'-phosphate oxidase family protein [Aestuariispira ectoiniformans]
MPDSIIPSTEDHSISSIEELEEVYGPVPERALKKEIDYISDDYRTWIENSPFVAVATVGPEGMDCSPRGDAPGFVHVVDNKTLLIPDRRGNNRLDTLRNIVRDDRISLLFLIPGIGETMRVNGRAVITTEPELCASFEVQGKAPASVIRITVERIYFQCQKAIARSGLWKPESQVERGTVPTAGKMLNGVMQGFDGEAYDRNYPEHMKKTIY